jgi:hypothetical protein
VFVKRAITSPPQTHTTLIDRAAYCATGLHAIAARFDTEVTAGVGLIGMEFAGPADFGPVSAIGPADEAVLAGFAERLRARGKIDRFGVRLIRNQLGLCDDKNMMETCDKPRRSLHCSVIDTADIPTDNAVETTWRVKPVAVEDRGRGRPRGNDVVRSVQCYHYCWGC